MIHCATGNMAQFIFDMQFVSGNNGQYFPKELAVLPFGSVCPTFYLLKPPYPYQELTIRASLQNRYDRENINGLHWNDGDVCYNNLPEILAPFTSCTIYVKGDLKENFIKKYLPDTEIVQLKIPKLNELQNFQTYCQNHSKTPLVRCAVQNCINIYLYILINKISI